MSQRLLLATWLALATAINAQFLPSDRMAMPQCVQDCLLKGFWPKPLQPLCDDVDDWRCFCSTDGLKDIWGRVQPCMNQAPCTDNGAGPANKAYASSIFSARCILKASSTVTIGDYSTIASAISTPTSSAPIGTTTPAAIASVAIQTPASPSSVAVYVPLSVIPVVTLIPATPAASMPMSSTAPRPRPALPSGYTGVMGLEVAYQEVSVAGAPVAPTVIVVAPAAASVEVQVGPVPVVSASAMPMVDMTMPSPVASAALSQLAAVASAVSLQTFASVATPAVIDQTDYTPKSLGKNPTAAMGQSAVAVSNAGSTIEMLMPMPDMATYSSTDAVARPAGAAQSGASSSSGAHSGASAMSGNNNNGMVMAGPGGPASSQSSQGPSGAYMPFPGSSGDYATYSDGPSYGSSSPASPKSYTGGSSSQGSSPHKSDPNALRGMMGGYTPLSYHEPQQMPPFGMPYAGPDDYEAYDDAGAPASGSGMGYRPAIYRGASASGAARQTDSAAIVTLAAGLVAVFLI